MKSIKLTFHPLNDEHFGENLHELRAVQANVAHVSVIRNGRAQSCNFVPRVLPDRWFEYDGYRCPLCEIGDVTVYLHI